MDVTRQEQDSTNITDNGVKPTDEMVTTQMDYSSSLDRTMLPPVADKTSPERIEVALEGGIQGDVQIPGTEVSQISLSVGDINILQSDSFLGGNGPLHGDVRKRDHAGRADDSRIYGENLWIPPLKTTDNTWREHDDISSASVDNVIADLERLAINKESGIQMDGVEKGNSKLRGIYNGTESYKSTIPFSVNMCSDIPYPINSSFLPIDTSQTFRPPPGLQSPPRPATRLVPGNLSEDNALEHRRIDRGFNPQRFNYPLVRGYSMGVRDGFLVIRQRDRTVAGPPQGRSPLEIMDQY